MGAISSWLNEHRQTKMVNAIIDDTNSRLRQRDELLKEFFPVREYDSRDFLAYIVNRVHTLASIVAPNGEIPVTSQGNLNRLTTRLIKIALERQYNEETQWRMEDAMAIAAGRGVRINDRKLPSGQIIKGANNTLAHYLFGNIKDLTKAVHDTLHVMSWQCVQFGEIDFSDFRTGIRTKIDWKRQGVLYDHFPAPLVATGSAIAKENVWTDYANADGIQNLADAIDTYHDTNGHTADLIVMSRKLRNDLLQQQSTKDAVRTSLVVPQAGAVSPDMLNAILSTREIPPIKTFDEIYEVENDMGQVIQGRFFNENRFALLTKDMGERAYGVTLESKQGLEGTPKTGVFVRTYEKQKSPLLDVTQAIATALPIVINPKLLYSQQVKA